MNDFIQDGLLHNILSLPSYVMNIVYKINKQWLPNIYSSLT